MRIVSPQDFGAVVKGRRLDLQLSQQQLADNARVSRKWISDFERGKPKAEVVLVLAVFEALGLELSVVSSPEAPASRGDHIDQQLRNILENTRPQP